MAHKDKSSYAKKHSPELKVNPAIAEAVQHASIIGVGPRQLIEF
jgi:hypothetical protein